MTDSTKWIWLADEKHLFVKAIILEEHGDKYDVRVQETGETKTVDASQIEKVNPAQFNKVGDMAELTYLNEPSVVNNLSTRWQDGDIYTYSGLFLVAVNPYKPLSIYSEDSVQQFKGKRRDETQPHIYAVAEQAFRSMLETRRDQSILITGESGAGKTENTKKAIQYLSSVTNSGSSRGIDSRILQTNPILEAFGNAQTIRNSNSSRFGKFIKIQFARESNSISGASIQWYLLEKSRVVTQHPDERNYHVFYQLLAGAPAELKQRLQIPENASPSSFNYLASGTPTIDGVDDSQLYSKLVDAFNIMGFSANDINSIMELVASVLLLGEIKFKATSADQGSVVDMKNVERVSKLLGVKPDEFIQSILQPRVKVGREVTTQSRNAAQAQHTTNAVAKALYERLFGYIVEQLNARLGKENPSSCSIGVLDIAGFEIFQQNSFEQLCINYTNEKLQQFFNHHMFVLEQEEYVKEDVDWDYVDYGNDLQPTIDLIEQAKNPMGIFSCLNEESVLPSGSDTSFNEKLVKQWDGKNAKFTPSRLGSGFKIDHYAQTVEYQTDGWIEKNKDPLSDAVESVLSDSSNNIVKSLFSTNEASKLKGKANLFRTVAQRHKEQLNSLMTHLEATQPHFVRCIIPNTHRSPSVFDNHLVLDQLRYNGVLEGIRIARSGFPNRLEFSDFCKRYKALARSINGPLDSQQTCATIIQRIKLDPSEYKVGLSKVFFRNGVLAKLEQSLDELVSQQALTLQALARGSIARMGVKREMHRRRAAKLIAACFAHNNKYSDDPWWQFNLGLKPLLMSKESMDSSKKDLRMQKLESALHRLKEEQVELISSKNDLRGELITTLHAKEDLSKSLEEALRESKEHDENHELAMNSARARDEASTSALRELSNKHGLLRAELDEVKAAKLEAEKRIEEGAQEKLENALSKLKEETALRQKVESERDSSLKQLKEQAEAHNGSNQKLQTELSKSQDEFKRIEVEVKNIKNELKQAQESNKSLEARMEETIKSKDERISSLESQLSKAEAALHYAKQENADKASEIQSKLEASEAKYDELTKLHGLKLKELTAANSESLETQEKLNKSSDELSKLQEWLSRAKSELRTAAQTRKDHVELQEQHKLFVETSEKTTNQLKKDLQEARRTSDDLKDKVSKSVESDKLESTLADNRKLSKDLDVATENLLKLNDELLQFRNQVESVKKQLTEANAKNESLEKSSKALGSSSKNLEIELTTAKSDLQTSEKTVSNLKTALEKAQSEASSKSSQIKTLISEKNEIESELKESRDKLAEYNGLLTSRNVSVSNQSISANFDVNRKLAATRMELSETKKALLRAQTQAPVQNSSATSPYKKRFGDGDAEHELALKKQELAQVEAQVAELEADLESARKEVAQGIILRQKYEKLQREKAMLAQDKSQLMLGVKANRGQYRELEVAKARASEVKRLQSELNVLNLKLVRSERDRKALEKQVSSAKVTDGSSSADDNIDSLRHRLRLAEIAKLQLSKTVHEIGKNRSSGIALDSPDIDSKDDSIFVPKRSDPHALRNISNDRRVSEQTHLAAEQVKNVDLEDALETYKSRAADFHAKLEKAELVVQSALRSEKVAKEQVEEYRIRLDRIHEDHNAEISDLRREVKKSRHEIDSRDVKIEDLLIKANFSVDLQNQMKTMNNTLKDLSTERDRLAKDKARLEKRLHTIVSSFDEQPRKLQEQLATMKQNEQHMLRDHGELRWKLERKARLVDQLRRSLSDADERIEQCRAEIDRLHAEDETREIKLRRANREITENNEKYLMAERELEQYRLSRRSTVSSAPRIPRDTRPAFV